MDTFLRRTNRTDFMDMEVSDSEDDLDRPAIIPDHVFTEDDLIETVVLEGEPEVEEVKEVEAEDNVIITDNDGEDEESDEDEEVNVNVVNEVRIPARRKSRQRQEEVNVSRSSHRSRFSRADLDSDSEGTVEGNLTFEYHDGP